MAREVSCTAARAMMPTVDAFRPDRRPYTGPGSLVPILPMPSDSKYIPTAPGRLGWAHGRTF